MSNIKTTLRLAAMTAGVALVVAPLGTGFQRPPPNPFDGVAEVSVGCLGYGKGELVLPLVGEDGRMSGFLVDCEGVRQFRLEALLTGCMPAQSVGQAGYWFGGLYGKVWKLGKQGEQPSQYVPVGAAYGLDGTWMVDESGRGSFSAQALGFTAAGRMDVVGEVYGKFLVAPEDPLGLTATWSDRAPPSKAIKRRFGDAASQGSDPVYFGDAASVPRKGGKSRFGDAASQGSDPVYFGDAASVPRKGGKSRFGDAASQGSDPVYFGDAASVPRKGGKSRFGDAASEPVPSQLSGCFYLRFHFDV